MSFRVPNAPARNPSRLSQVLRAGQKMKEASVGFGFRGVVVERKIEAAPSKDMLYALKTKTGRVYNVSMDPRIPTMENKLPLPRMLYQQMGFEMVQKGGIVYDGEGNGWPHMWAKFKSEYTNPGVTMYAQWAGNGAMWVFVKQGDDLPDGFYSSDFWGAL